MAMAVNEFLTTAVIGVASSRWRCLSLLKLNETELWWIFFFARFAEQHRRVRIPLFTDEAIPMQFGGNGLAELFTLAAHALPPPPAPPPPPTLKSLLIDVSHFGTE